MDILMVMDPELALPTLRHVSLETQEEHLGWMEQYHTDQVAWQKRVKGSPGLDMLIAK